MNTLELTQYIESLRRLRNVELEDFTKDIVSTRQYKRYLNGTSEMSYRVFYLLAEKLQLNPVSIQMEIERAKEEQNKQIEKLYNLIVSQQFEKVEAYLQEQTFEPFLSDGLEMYYKTAMVIYEYYIHKEDKKIYRDRLFKIVDYDNIIKKELFDQVELLVLSLLLMFMEETQKQVLLDKLAEQLKKTRVTLGIDIYSKLFVTLRITREYGIKKEYHKVIELCLQSLQDTKRMSIHFNYDFFYYYLALSYKALKDDKNKNKYLKKLYHYLLFVDEKHKTEKYIEKFKNDFNVSLEEVEAL